MLFKWQERESWRPLVEKTRGTRQTRTSILNTFRGIYTGIEVYHGCRPVDVSEYYRHGLRVADHEVLTATARKLFLSGEFPEIDEVRFQESLRKLSGIDNRIAYVMLDSRYLVEHCAHYLIYGSEHICGIAASLMSGPYPDYRQALKRFGRPTLLRLALPLDTAQSSDLDELADHLLAWTSKVRAGRTPWSENFTFSLKKHLPPDFVLSHEHPTRIKDPLLWQEYVFEGKENGH